MEITIILVGVTLLLILTILGISFQRQKSIMTNDKEPLIRIESNIARLDSLIRDEFSRNRDEIQNIFQGNRTESNNTFKNLGDTIQGSLKDNKDELSKSLKSFEDQFGVNVKDFNGLQKQKFDDLISRIAQIKSDSEIRLDKIKDTVDTNLQKIQEQNSKKLDEMRATVDEKLQSTLEKRFNESFTVISNRLDQVHQGLGEMQKLASGVGDLKKVLTNVKTRGSLGEIQLGNILEQIFSPSQYEKNSSVKKGSLERVEFTVKLPGKSDDNTPVLLPIDSKFPNEDYQRLIEVYENIANLSQQEIEEAIRNFDYSVKKCAKDIRDKYINPPVTTDFAIMFVPTEGLYAEILRRTGLFEMLQREYHVIVVGPTNLAAFLNSLQMGFRTLAIEKRSSEVWLILSAIKTQFGDFGKILDKTKKKLQEASNVIEDASIKSRGIERKLRTVQELPSADAIALIGKTINIENEEGESSNQTDEEVEAQKKLFD